MKRGAFVIIPILLIIAACGGAGGSQTQTLNIAYPNAHVVTVNLATTTGQIALWYMDGATLVGGGAIDPVPINNYIAVGPH